MSPSFKRITGMFILAIAALSLVVSLYLLVQVWRWRLPLMDGLLATTRTLSDTLDNTLQGLDSIDGTLASTSDSLAALQMTVRSGAVALENQHTLTASLQTSLTTDLPATVAAIQTSFTSAQASAKLIDDMLAGLSKIPLLNLGAYQPATPLNVALGQAADSLGKLTPALKTAGNSLAAGSADLGILEEQLTAFADSLDAVIANLDTSQSVISNYRQTVKDLQKRLEEARTAIPTAVRTVCWLLTLVIVWMGVAQFDLLLRGLERWREIPR